MGYAGEKTLIPALPPRKVYDAAMLILALSISLGFIWGIVSLTAVGLIDEQAMTAVLSLLAPLVTMVQYVAPSPVVLESTRSMNGTNLSRVSFQLQAGCNILGMSYGIQIINPTVLVSNMFGLGCQILYLTADMYIRAPSTNWLWFWFQMATLFNCSLFFFATITPLQVLGHGITILNISLCAVPLAMMGPILRTRISTLPYTMISVAVANNCVWSLYGFLIQDTVLLLPSVIGYLLSIFQVMVILWCRGMLPFDLLFLQLVCRDHRQVSSEEKGREPLRIGIPGDDVEMYGLDGEEESGVAAPPDLLKLKRTPDSAAVPPDLMKRTPALGMTAR